MILRSKSLKRTRRSGAAVAELAVASPVLILLLLGSIEACNMIFLRQGLTAAAYEAGRIAIRADADDSEVSAAAQEVLVARGIANAEISTTPSSIEDLDRGTSIAVRIDCAADAYSILPSGPYGGRSIQVSFAAVKE